MTGNEQRQIQELIELARSIKEGNKDFRDMLSSRVDELEAKIDAKHVPIQLEASIIHSVNDAVRKSITSALSEYNSPLKKLTDTVIEEHRTELRAIIGACFEQTIRHDDFRASVLEAFNHKIARLVISNNESLIDKVSNDLKSDATFRAKLTLAVSGVVDTFLAGKSIAEGEE